jgi:cell division protein FtsI (penicillin-binding protein 3)
VGFAPATNPRFAVLMRIDKPAGAPVAGLTVVPAFRELAEFILGYYNIAPDRLAE